MLDADDICDLLLEPLHFRTQYEFLRVANPHDRRQHGVTDRDILKPKIDERYLQGFWSVRLSLEVGRHDHPSQGPNVVENIRANRRVHAAIGKDIDLPLKQFLEVLSGRSSPRAAEPNRRVLRAPWAKAGK